MTNEVLKEGKKIYNLTLEFQKEPLSDVIKKAKMEERDGRYAYWSYVLFELCGIKKYLIENKREDVINECKPYKMANYASLIKEKVNSVTNIDDEFKEYIIEFFLKTYHLQERELRAAIYKEIEEESNLVKSLRKEILAKNIEIEKLRHQASMNREALVKAFETNFKISLRMEKSLTKMEVKVGAIYLLLGTIFFCLGILFQYYIKGF